jgi:hypothetical protein
MRSPLTPPEPKFGNSPPKARGQFHDHYVDVFCFKDVVAVNLKVVGLAPVIRLMTLVNLARLSFTMTAYVMTICTYNSGSNRVSMDVL